MKTCKWAQLEKVIRHRVCVIDWLHLHPSEGLAAQSHKHSLKAAPNGALTTQSRQQRMGKRAREHYQQVHSVLSANGALRELTNNERDGWEETANRKGTGEMKETDGEDRRSFFLMKTHQWHFSWLFTNVSLYFYGWQFTGTCFHSQSRPVWINISCK